MVFKLVSVIGLTSTLACMVEAANIVKNPNLTDEPILSSTDFPDWTVGPNGAPDIDTGLGGPTVPDGVNPVSPITPFPGDPNFFSFGAFAFAGAGTITQDLSTVAGQEYTISYWAATNSTDYTNALLNVNWGGSLAMDITSSLPTTQDWVQFSTTVKATSATTALQFAGFKNAGFYEVTDISVTPSTSTTPSPAAIVPFCLGILSLRGRRRVG